MKYSNAEVIIHEKGLNVEDFVDACYGNLVYKNAIICMNKIDLFNAVNSFLRNKSYLYMFVKGLSTDP